MKKRFFSAITLLAFALKVNVLAAKSIGTIIPGIKYEFTSNKKKQREADDLERRFWDKHKDYPAILKSYDIKKATAFLNNILKSEPTNFVALTELMALECGLRPMDAVEGDVSTSDEVAKVFLSVFSLNDNYYFAWRALQKCAILDYETLKTASEIAISLKPENVDAYAYLAIAEFAVGKNREALSHLDVARKTKDSIGRLSLVEALIAGSESQSMKPTDRSVLLTEAIATLEKLTKDQSKPIRRKAHKLFILHYIEQEKWEKMAARVRAYESDQKIDPLLNEYYKAVYAEGVGNLSECIAHAEKAVSKKWNYSDLALAVKIRCHGRLQEPLKVWDLFTSDLYNFYFFAGDTLNAVIASAKILGKGKDLQQIVDKKFVAYRAYAQCEVSKTFDHLEDAIRSCENAYNDATNTACDKAELALSVARLYARTMGTWSSAEKHYFELAFNSPCAPNNYGIVSSMYDVMANIGHRDLKFRLEKMRKESPDSLYPKLFYARLLSQVENNHSAAIDLLEGVDESNMSGFDKERYYTILSEIYADSKDLNSALKLADKMLASSPSIQALTLKVHTLDYFYNNQEGAEKILAEFEKYKSLVDKNSLAGQLALIYAKALRFRKPDEAIKVLTKSLPTAGNGASLQNYWMARIYAEVKKDCKAAKPYAKRAWDLDAQNLGKRGFTPASGVLNMEMMCGIDLND